MRNMIDEQYRTNVCSKIVQTMLDTVKDLPIDKIPPEELEAWKDQTEMMFFRMLTNAYNVAETEEKEHLTGSD